MKHNIREPGKKINNMVKGRRPGLMGPCMREIIYWARNMARDVSDGLMALYTLASSLIIILKGLVSINGQMAGLIMVNGKIIKCMAKEYLLGLMGEDMRVNILKIKSKVKVHSTGQMEENMLDNGEMESSMEKDYLWQ
jgi:hypothetical protein